jgi:hypothetical protein
MVASEPATVTATPMPTVPPDIVAVAVRVVRCEPLIVWTVRLSAVTLALSPTKARVSALMLARPRELDTATPIVPEPTRISPVALAEDVEVTVTSPLSAVTSALAPR